MLRTHTCGELSEKDVGKSVTLCGWVGSRRDHGNIMFIDLRDAYGITQLIFNLKDKGLGPEAENLRSEFVVEVKGKAEKRPKGTENDKIPTGKIEVLVEGLKVLNRALTPPFEVLDNLEVGEETRLKHRYIDLRRPSMQKNLRLRHKVSKIMRDFLDARGFIEVETPMLTKSTPEGARDYLVPSRLNPGMFYALPQSPQLFKQILMVSSLDRYFQIAKCFRDEDLRADRQPEFTQLDIEMSFADEEDIFALSEDLMKILFKESMGINLKTPFPRMKYSDAIAQFNTDKPDTRKNKEKNIFNFLWVTDFPLFKFNEEESRWESEHHPFTSVHPDDIVLLDKREDLGRARARSYDLVVNGVELGSGSIRINDQALQEKIFRIIGLKKEDASMRFGFLLEAFKYGAPPHGGIAFGLDRLLTLLVGCESIRDVIAFPKTQRAFCPMTNAPSPVDEKQLNELNIKIKQ
ncbi:MAG: aspartate--tRNA ligase [Candidatus Omnitrophica bacterium]|nr:aspartate--tRNA ligase [Candidatus Omnitrophota bacterium]